MNMDKGWYWLDVPEPGSRIGGDLILAATQSRIGIPPVGDVIALTIRKKKPIFSVVIYYTQPDYKYHQKGDDARETYDNLPDAIKVYQHLAEIDNHTGSRYANSGRPA